MLGAPRARFAVMCALGQMTRAMPRFARRAVRGGNTGSQVVLGGQRIEIKRPRARALDAGELELPTFAWAAGADPLNAATMGRIAAGLSTRRYAGTLDELAPPHRALSTSKRYVFTGSVASGRSTRPT